ncbi:helix-turn-helix domain-containing protein [Dorea longicatena]|uniref:Helix-turn-helix domain-containing protein n=1 Tax=Dorea longicatena TaxID=88431 RepID=A0A6N9JUG9_9FIRM|nr:helix-turn-helix transcriptional regulator [Dorea longicatena]MZK06836.1 helix-turn-helix domain-containing protein [Dorea longicatena]MZK09399.1 helix-turn-helix domain-containing protein [Dorea longicatena]MZK45805.1 helix-turn-helix domain-containing protein [Dorea longicatena]
MVGKKIRAYREFRGYSQIQLAELSSINVGTIRKYELGIRNPKPDQLEKIATALGLNVSVFLDFNIETVGDVLSLLFSIDDSVNLSLAETPDQKVALTFDNSTMQDFFKKWCQFKNVYEKEKAEILSIEDAEERQEELDKLNATQEEWKLRAMGTTIGCHTIVKKGAEGNDIKTYDLT